MVDRQPCASTTGGGLLPYRYSLFRIERIIGYIALRPIICLGDIRQQTLAAFLLIALHPFVISAIVLTYHNTILVKRSQAQHGIRQTTFGCTAIETERIRKRFITSHTILITPAQIVLGSHVIGSGKPFELIKSILDITAAHRLERSLTLHIQTLRRHCLHAPY